MFLLTDMYNRDKIKKKHLLLSIISNENLEIKSLVFICNTSRGYVAFMRRKNTTKQMMKEYMCESLVLLLREKSYEEITISEIVNKAGVNRSTYYRNFLSKDDIVVFFYEKIMLEYLNLYQAQSSNTLDGYLCTMFKHFYTYKNVLLLFYKNGLSHLLLIVLNSFFEKQVIEKLPQQEHFKIYYHIGGIYNFFILWFSHDMVESPKELTKISLSLLPPDARPMLMANNL